LFLQNRLGGLTIPISPDCSKLDIAVNPQKIGDCLAVAGKLALSGSTELAEVLPKGRRHQALSIEHRTSNYV